MSGRDQGYRWLCRGTVLGIRYGNGNGIRLGCGGGATGRRDGGPEGYNGNGQTTPIFGPDPQQVHFVIIIIIIIIIVVVIL